MNYPILSLLLLLSLSASAQVESVELFPDHINKSVLHVSSPSMNKAENRLCYKTAVSLNYVIMISDKGADGAWGEPYPAVPQGEVDGFQGCTISPDGNRIYFDKDNDIYTIDFVSVGKWSKPQMVKSPVSNDEMECRPSVSHDNQTLLFLRNIRNDNGEWQLVPFITKRTDKDKWAPSKKIKLDMRENEELYVLHHTGENKVFFFQWVCHKRIGQTTTPGPTLPVPFLL